MKLKGKEKYFWEKNFNVKNPAAIPSHLDGIRGIDSDHDDEFFYFLSRHVISVNEIHLRCTNITDEAVKYISNFKDLRCLMIKDHRHVTAACLPYINKLDGLEYLDISKNNIHVTDLYVLDKLQRLQQLYISADMLGDDETDIPRGIRAMFSDCRIEIY